MGLGRESGIAVPPAGSRIVHSVRARNHGRHPSQAPNPEYTPSETFATILGMKERVPKSDPAIRAQALWDEGCGRRAYDIVSGVRLPLPTAKPERAPGRLAHPSQQSLERGRNLQASLIPA